MSLNGQTYKHTVSDWNDTESQDNALYRVLSVSGLNWPVEDVPRAGVLLTVQVRRGSGAAVHPVR